MMWWVVSGAAHQGNKLGKHAGKGARRRLDGGGEEGCLTLHLWDLRGPHIPPVMPVVGNAAGCLGCKERALLLALRCCCTGGQGQ